MYSEADIGNRGVSHRKTLVANFFSLSGLEVVSNFLPLITIPYIVRIIGAEYFGLISFASAFVIFFNVFVKYGFDYSATREISVKRENPEELSRIVSLVYSAKLVLLLISTVVFLLILFFVPRFTDEFRLYMYAYLLVLGTAMFPTWLFQGMEKLTLSALFNFIMKVGFTGSVFLFVREEGHYLYVPFINGIAHTGVGLISLVYAVKVFQIRLTAPSWSEIVDTIKNGWTVFTSMVVINLYTTSNAVLLGLLAGNIYVGYFAAAEKVVRAMQSLLFLPLSQTLYPHIGKILNQAYDRGIHLLKQMTFLVGGITLFGSVAVFFLAQYVVLILFGSGFEDTVAVLKILVFVTCIKGVGTVFSIQGLLNLKMDRAFFVVNGIGAVVNIALNVILIPYLYEIGTSLAWLLSELSITVVSFYILYQKGINLIDFSIVGKMLRIKSVR